MTKDELKILLSELRSFPNETEWLEFKVNNAHDCFLFMVATGQYHADIDKMSLTISNAKGNSKHCSYRRAMNKKSLSLIIS